MKEDVIFMRKILSSVIAGMMIFSNISFPAEAEENIIDSGIDYTESTETIENPGAGYTSTLWYRCKPNETPVYNPSGNLVLMFIDIGGFSSGANGTTDDSGNYTEGTDYDLDETFFTNLRKTLDNCRRNGCTVAMRFRYDANGKSNPEPSSYEKMESHIEQIRADGFLEEYKDIIAFVESGFVGCWGEHWGGKYCSFEDKAKLLDILLDVVPKEIPVTVRTPKTFATWAGIEMSELENYTCEPDSEASRIGLYDDGYMGSDSDLGTYENRERDTSWLGRQTLYTYFGGEFSGNLDFAKKYETYLPQNAVPEMYKTHLSYINSNIYKLYKDYTFGAEYDVENVDNSAYYGQTVFKFMRDHLGYRFVLRDSDLSAETEQGGILSIKTDIENTGFANPIMNQKAEIILEKDGNYIKAPVEANTREWYSCSVVSPEFEMKIPGGLETGEWNVYFKISTGNNRKDEMNFRSVKFANNNIWNSALGANYIGSFSVTESGDSSKLADNSFYQADSSQTPDYSASEMFTLNDMAFADGYVSNDFEHSEQIKRASSDGNSLYITNDDRYLYVMAEINHNAVSPVYNISVKNESTSKSYWLYYQGNGFIYFNNGVPSGCIQKHSGNTVEFRIPFGEVMGIESGAVLSNIRVFIQDESDSWKNVGELNSGEYIVSDNFNIYSGKKTVYLSDGEDIELNADTSVSDGLSYQWLLNGKELSGETSSKLDVKNISAEKRGLYSVRIASSGGAVKTADICEISDIPYSDIKGDINADGKVNIADGVILQKYLLCESELSSQQSRCADVNEDGYINAFDLCRLRTIIKI